MKATALVYRLRTGEIHVMVDTLAPERVAEAYANSSRVFPETTPELLELDLPVEEVFRNARGERDTIQDLSIPAEEAERLVGAARNG